MKYDVFKLIAELNKKNGTESRSKVKTRPARRIGDKKCRRKRAKFPKGSIVTTNKGHRDKDSCAICSTKTDTYYTITFRQTAGANPRPIGNTVCIDCLRDIYELALEEDKSLFDISQMMKKYMGNVAIDDPWDKYWEAHKGEIKDHAEKRGLKQAQKILKKYDKQKEVQYVRNDRD